MAASLAKRGPGLHHVALHVNDISATFEEMKSRGLKTALPDDIQIGAGGHLYFFVHPSSAGGVLTEICQDPHQQCLSAPCFWGSTPAAKEISRWPSFIPMGTLTSRGRQQFSGRHQATELLSEAAPAAQRSRSHSE